jgi:hypothetical protein
MMNTGLDKLSPQRQPDSWRVTLARSGFRILGLFLPVLAGCGGKERTFPVAGKVVFEDDSPVSGGTVEFMATSADGKVLNARGTIDEHGGFILGTFAPGDGAIVGEHQAVVIAPVIMSRGDLTKIFRATEVDPRFASYGTSGLEYEVKTEKNYFVIKVARERR